MARKVLTLSLIIILAMQNANQPSKDHIQGILLKGYSKYPHVFYVMLQIEDTAKCKSWLGETTFQHMTSEMAEFPLNIAFTSKGLTKLGIQNLEDTLSTHHT